VAKRFHRSETHIEPSVAESRPHESAVWSQPCMDFAARVTERAEVAVKVKFQQYIVAGISTELVSATFSESFGKEGKKNCC